MDEGAGGGGNNFAADRSIYYYHIVFDQWVPRGVRVVPAHVVGRASKTLLQ